MLEEKIATAKDIVDALQSVLGRRSVPLHEPRFYGNEQRYVQDCITSTYVSSVGKYVDRFELELANYTGARRAVAVVNGTAALQVSLRLAGVQANDEVIVPALSFVATANAVSYIGAIPHFADVELDSLGLDPLALRDWLKSTCELSGGAFRNRFTGRRVRAIVPMHTFGHPCNIDEIVALAHDYKMVVVEDAAESLGSFYGGKHTGTFGLLSAISFNGNKIITTGGGGAILTNDEKLADYAKHLTTTAKQPHKWNYIHDAIGYNYRMPNLNAALGCAQLEQLTNFIESKRKLYNLYLKAFSGVKKVSVIREPRDCQSNYWLQTILLDNSMATQRNEILKIANANNIMTRPAWDLINTLEPYKSCPKAPLPMAENLVQRIVNIPSSAGLAELCYA